MIEVFGVEDRSTQALGRRDDGGIDTARRRWGNWHRLWGTPRIQITSLL